MNRIRKAFAIITMGPLVVMTTLVLVPQGFWLPTALCAVPLVIAWDLHDQRKAELAEIEAFANSTDDDEAWPHL